jgi:hypothetical protein
MLRLLSAGSVTFLRASVYEMLLRRRLMVGTRGAELTRWLALRESLPPLDALTVRCLFADGESKSVMEKERLGREASSETSVEGCRRMRSRALELGASVLVAITAVMLSGVPGLLIKKTLSPSSLTDSSISSAPADTDRASTSVGLCFPSGKILRKPCIFDNVRSLATLAVKKCAYSGSLSAFRNCRCSFIDASSAVISSSGLWCCSVADRWWLVAGRRNDGRSDPEPWVGVSSWRRTDEDRLTSLFGGKGDADRLPTMGAVEPSWENAIEPLEHDTDGDSGAGLGFLLDCCELEMLDSRCIHDLLREGTCVVASSSAIS